jgi:hypothetical protein
MSGLVVCIDAMDSLLHQHISTMIVRIYGSLGTQWISGGQLRIMKRVLDGDMFAWGLMLHAKMIGQIHRCRTTDSSEFSFLSILVAWFLDRVPMLCPRVFLLPAGPAVGATIDAVGSAFAMAQRGRGWPLFYSHIGMCVAPYSIDYTVILIWWDGFPA